MTNKYNNDITHKVHKVKKQLGIPETGFVNFDIIKEKLPKLTLATARLSMTLSGLIYKIDNEESIIVLNGAYDKLEQRFTFAHELYHLYFSDIGKIICPPQNSKLARSGEEKRADLFASHFLLPDIDMRDFIESDFNGVIDEKTIVGIMERYQVDLYTLFIRLKYDGFLNDDIAFETFQSKCQKYIHESEILEPLLIKHYDCKTSLSGYYISLCDKAYKEDKISYGKYKELMNDGFSLDKIIGEIDE